MNRITLLLAAWVAMIVALLVMPLGGVAKDVRSLGDFDKVIHAMLFVGYAWLGMAAFEGHTWKRAVLVILSGLLLGGGTELLQGILPWERGARLSDFIADTAGLLVGLAIFTWTDRRNDTENVPCSTRQSTHASRPSG